MAEGWTYIYALRCPDTNEVRYIGKSVSPKDRLAAHKRAAKSPGLPVHRWIAKLSKSGKQPIQTIERRVASCEWQEAEITAIIEARKAGCRLLNILKGGNGGFLPGSVPALESNVCRNLLSRMSNSARSLKREGRNPELQEMLARAATAWKGFYKKSPSEATRFVLADPLLRQYAGVV